MGTDQILPDPPTPASAAAGGAPKYDDDGNLLTYGDRWDYTWDAENRLYSMQERGEMGEGTQRIEFRYDHLSRRYWKQTFTSVAGDDAGEFVWQKADAMTFVYDGWNCIEQTSATDTFHADFLWGTDLSGSHQRAGGVGGLLLRVDTVTHNAEEPVFRRSYPTYDGNGNVSEHARRPVEWVDCPVGNPARGEQQAVLRDHYLDSAGAVAAHFEPERSGDRLERSDEPHGWQSHQYGAFGRTTKTTSAGAGGSLPAEMDLTQLDEVHRFSTKPLGQQTGLYYYGYRFYDPQTGRWPSRDPIGEEGGINLYAMVGNDAIGRWDYLGLADLGEKTFGCYKITASTSKYEEIHDDDGHQYGVDISLKISASNTGTEECKKKTCCTKVKVIQIVKTRNAAILDYRRPRTSRSGWRIDASEVAGEPFVSDTEHASARGMTGKLSDSPRQRRSARGDNLTFYALTCLVCVEGEFDSDKGKKLGCVGWGFKMVQDPNRRAPGAYNVTKFSATIRGPGGNVGRALNDAAAQWERNRTRGERGERSIEDAMNR